MPISAAYFYAVQIAIATLDPPKSQGLSLHQPPPSIYTIHHTSIKPLYIHVENN